MSLRHQDSLYVPPAVRFNLTRWEVMLLRSPLMLSNNIDIWTGGEAQG